MHQQSRGAKENLLFLEPAVDLVQTTRNELCVSETIAVIHPVEIAGSYNVVYGLI